MSVAEDVQAAGTKSDAGTIAAIICGAILVVISWHIGWVSGYGHGLIQGMEIRGAETPSYEAK